MYEFKRSKLLDNYKKVYCQCAEVERIADIIAKKDITSMHMLGCGGAFTKFMSMRQVMRKYLSIPTYVNDPVEFLCTDYPNIDANALVMIGTKTGVTEELITVVKKLKEKKVTILGFVGDENTEIEAYLDYKICSVCTDVHIILLALFMLRYLEQKGHSMGYETFKKELQYFGEDLADAIESNLEKGKKHVSLALKKDYQMWVTSGNLWGEISCYSKYVIEEVQWRKCQAVHAGEFFHGPLELVDEELCINVVLNDGDTREMDERVASFVKKYGRDYTIFDMRDFVLPHISKRFLPYVYPYVLNIYLDELSEMYKPITNRTMENRRYYRKVEY